MNVSLLLGWGTLLCGWHGGGGGLHYCMTEIVRWDHAVIISTVNTGILILIQIGCVYTKANWIKIQTQTTSLM